MKVDNTEQPRLSICIATRNRADFISETLDSIVGQIETGVEIVIVDGASSDETPKVLGRYLAQAAPPRAAGLVASWSLPDIPVENLRVLGRRQRAS